MVWQLRTVRIKFAKISVHCHVLTCFNSTEYIFLLVVEQPMNIYLLGASITGNRGEILSFQETVHFAECGLLKTQLWAPVSGKSPHGERRGQCSYSLICVMSILFPWSLQVQINSNSVVVTALLLIPTPGKLPFLFTFLNGTIEDADVFDWAQVSREAWQLSQLCCLNPSVSVSSSPK